MDIVYMHKRNTRGSQLSLLAQTPDILVDYLPHSQPFQIACNHHEPPLRRYLILYAGKKDLPLT